MCVCVSVCACSFSLKQSVSLLELEQQLTWIRAEVESRQPLQRYLLAADEDALADQVVTHARTHTKRNRQVSDSRWSSVQAVGLTEDDTSTIRLLNETRDMLERYKPRPFFTCWMCVDYVSPCVCVCVCPVPVQTLTPSSTPAWTEDSLASSTTWPSSSAHRPLMPPPASHRTGESSWARGRERNCYCFVHYTGNNQACTVNLFYNRFKLAGAHFFWFLNSNVANEFCWTSEVSSVIKTVKSASFKGYATKVAATPLYCTTT